MPSRAFRGAFWVTALSLAALGFAQQGHPLTGTWSGNWGATASQQSPLTVVMNWDGKNVTGLINPGPDAIPITGVVVDVSTWSVRIEADTKDPSGKAVHIVADGKIEDLGSYHRTITGVWQQGAAKGEFKLTRE